MMLLATVIAVIALRYFTLSADVFFPEQREIYESNVGPLLLHVGGGVVALLLGPFQFVSSLRARVLGLHRWLGRSYLTAILLGALGAFLLAPLAYGGAPSRLGFGALAVCWLSTAALAYLAIRRRKIQVHRRWMIRSYSLTFAAVTLRLWLPALQGIGLSFTSAYIAVAWISWLPNLLVAELYLRSEMRMKGRLEAERRGV